MQAAESNQGLTFSVRLLAPENRSDELIKTFRSVLGPLRGTPGCRRCNLLEDVQRPNELQLIVEWRSREDFEHHVRTDLFRKILQGVELSAESPELEIRTIAGVQGIDLLHEILGTEDE